MKTEKMRISELLSRGSNVKELIRTLSKMNPDAIVVFQSDYGDYTHTNQISLIQSIESGNDVGEMYTTAYSHSGIAVRSYEEFEPDDLRELPDADITELPDVVILS